MRITQETIDAAKAEHGDNLFLIEADAAEVSVIAKPPTRIHYKRFMETAAKEGKRAAAMEALARDCIVWPAGSDLDQLLEEKPGIAATVSTKILEVAGVDEEATVKKL